MIFNVIWYNLDFLDKKIQIYKEMENGRIKVWKRPQEA